VAQREEFGGRVLLHVYYHYLILKPLTLNSRRTLEAPRPTQSVARTNSPALLETLRSRPYELPECRQVHLHSTSHPMGGEPAPATLRSTHRQRVLPSS